MSGSSVACRPMRLGRVGSVEPDGDRQSRHRYSVDVINIFVASSMMGKSEWWGQK